MNQSGKNVLPELFSFCKPSTHERFGFQLLFAQNKEKKKLERFSAAQSSSQAKEFLSR
jgi:hypothetical protein